MDVAYIRWHPWPHLMPWHAPSLSLSLSLSKHVSLCLLSHIIGWSLDISRRNIRSATEILMCSSSVLHQLLGWRHHITKELQSNNLYNLTVGYIRNGELQAIWTNSYFLGLLWGNIHHLKRIKKSFLYN
jgi:hypothetical protein